MIRTLSKIGIQVTFLTCKKVSTRNTQLTSYFTMRNLESKDFPTRSGAKQGGHLPPFLLNFMLEELVNAINQERMV